MSGSQAISRHLTGLHDLLCSLNPEQHAKAHEFWRAVRQTITDQDTEIHALRSTIDGLQQQLVAAANALNAQPRTVVAPPRPASSASVYDLRQQIDDMFQQQALQEPDASATIEAIADIDPAWAKTFLEKQIDRSKSSVIGCWFQGNVPKHPTGYCQVNMRNTIKPGTHDKFRVAPFVHQMAVVARGEGNRLRLTARDRSGERYEVSHLCHHPACFNPEHVAVEDASANKARGTCQGHRIVKLADGSTINPCRHWQTGVMRDCILPEVKLPPNTNGRYFGFRADGSEIIRTGRSTDYV
jgi:hypothetical protein